MTDQELKAAAASRRRQAARAEQERKRGKQRRSRRKAARKQQAPLAGEATGEAKPPDGTGRLYTHNSRKAKSAYHVAAARGTLCKMENSPFIKWQDAVTQSPPPGKRLCSMCADVLRRREAEALAWERLDAF